MEGYLVRSQRPVLNVPPRKNKKKSNEPPRRPAHAHRPKSQVTRIFHAFLLSKIKECKCECAAASELKILILQLWPNSVSSILCCKKNPHLFHERQCSCPVFTNKNLLVEIMCLFQVQYHALSISPQWNIFTSWSLALQDEALDIHILIGSL
jgi:hypothetical protein